MDKQSAGTASLKGRLSEELKTGGAATQEAPQEVKLTESTPVFRASSSDKVDIGPPTRSLPVVGDVDVPVPDNVDIDNDPLITGGGIANDSGKAVAEEAFGAEVFETLFSNALDTPNVTLTQEDRDAFLDALVAGTRYTRTFSIFNGRVTGTLRCRSISESEGIAAWIGLWSRTGKFANLQEYTASMRDAIIVAQVAKLHGVEFEEMTQPCGPKAGIDLKNWSDIPPPTWEPQIASWRNMPEAVVTAIFDEIKVFERKYWTMIAHAKDQNFWNPVASS